MSEKARASHRKWAKANPGAVKENKAKWDRENADHKREQAYAWKEANAGKAATSLFRAHLKKYGISPEQFEEMLVAQGGVCAGCRKTCTVFSRLSVDHDHDTGKVRGLLCSACNRAVGGLKHDPETLLRLAAYLTVDRT